MADDRDGFIYRIVGSRVYKIAGIEGPEGLGGVRENGNGKPADETQMAPSDLYPFEGGIVILEDANGKVRLIDKTSITTPPAATTTSRSVSIPFVSLQLDSAVTTECSLNGGTWGACQSPYTAEVGDGGHTFRVRATDALGTDPTPAEAKWTVSGTGTGTGGTGTGTTGTTGGGYVPAGAPPIVPAAPGGLPVAGLTTLTGPASLKASVFSAVGAAFTLICAESCAVTYSLALDSRTAKRLRLKNPVGKGSGVAAAGKATKLVFKPSKKAKAKLKKARKGRLVVTVEVEDAAGETTTLKRTIKLR